MQVCIIGAGPAGLMAAIQAATAGMPACVLETNAHAGRKLLLTGGGRCNFTHAGSPDEIAKAFDKAGRFLRHSLYELSPDDVREFFHSRGVDSTVEPDGCVFPASQRAADIRQALVDETQKLGTRFQYRSRVREIAVADNGFQIRVQDRRLTATRLVIATGGVSWPQTGSQGDGYRFAAELGHTIVPPKPALIPLVTRETWPGTLAGISISGVAISAIVRGHRLAAAGNMLFTQQGVGGPVVLDLSRWLVDELYETRSGINIAIDVLPRINEAQLDRRLQHDIGACPKKATANLLSELVPRQFVRTLCHLAPCAADLQAGQLSAEKRRRLVHLLKSLPLTVTGTEPMAKATVTRGGVHRPEINPRTMESKIRPGLFFAGEVIDLDGPCGGYNLQMCWSTGAVAGRAAACPSPGAGSSTP